MKAPTGTSSTLLRHGAIAAMLVTLALVTPADGPAAAAATTAGVSANSVVKGSLTKQSDLNFGPIVPGSAGGSVAVSAAGVRSATGSIAPIAGTVSNAEFKLTCQQNKVVTVLPIAPITINNGAGAVMNLTLNDVSISPSNGRCADVGLPGNLGEAQIAVGGTLVVGPLQAAGTYTGTFSVTVNF